MAPTYLSSAMVAEIAITMCCKVVMEIHATVIYQPGVAEKETSAK